MTENDEDGWSAENTDCDDESAELLVIANDQDCDGVQTASDCDDTDSLSTIIANDMDCDGVLTVDDCDDSDASMPNLECGDEFTEWCVESYRSLNGYSESESNWVCIWVTSSMDKPVPIATCSMVRPIWRKFRAVSSAF